ncbi:winged helix-turn-helix domain-containing protein [Streptosporangium sp. NPDC049644]|uniref:winged helix-turn-helix domain-containing protein n=1 Tax=Streptosporangium sp. NPDC049644 TaxID=3155507 RepID=UPI003431B3A6
MIDFEPGRPKWEQVAETFEQRIHSGEWPPGHKVPSIVAIMGDYAVGNNTARHVLRHLRDLGLVKLVPSLGTFVLPPGHTRQNNPGDSRTTKP